MNFGVEYFDSIHHSNIDVVLKDGSRVRANSVVLSMNSPYFKRVIEQKRIKQIEMTEVDAAVCRRFLKSLYTGVFGILDMQTFRQVSKLSFTFEVTWMQQECHAYFRKLLSDSSNNADHNLFLLEEAIAAKVDDKDFQYLDALTQQKTQTVSDQDIHAMETMLNDIRSLPVDYLDFFIRLANKCNRLSANNEYHNSGYDQSGGTRGTWTSAETAIVPRNRYSELLSRSQPGFSVIIPAKPAKAAIAPRNRVSEVLSYPEPGFSGNFPAPSEKEYCTALIEKMTRHLKNLKKIDVKTRYVLINLDFKGISSKFNQSDGRNHQYKSIDPFKTAASNFFETLLDLKEISNDDLRMILRQHMRLGN